MTGHTIELDNRQLSTVIRALREQRSRYRAELDASTRLSADPQTDSVTRTEMLGIAANWRDRLALLDSIAAALPEWAAANWTDPDW